MPGSLNPTETLVNSGHNGLQHSDIYHTTKDITKIQNVRRLNEYTTFPRRPRADTHSPPDSVRTVTKSNHVTIVDPKSDLPDTDSSTTSGSNPASPEKRERTWSFKKLRQALRRSKSLGKSKEDVKESESGSVKDLHKSQNDTAHLEDPQHDIAGVLFSSATQSTHNKPTIGQLRHDQPSTSSADYAKYTDCTYQMESGIYSELDIINSQHFNGSPKTARYCSGSVTSMATAPPLDKRASGSRSSGIRPESTDVTNKSGVLKVLSSLSIRNLTSKKKTVKKTKSSTENSDYPSNLSRDIYRGSFKEGAFKNNVLYASTDCRRCRSFTAPSGNRVPKSGYVEHKEPEAVDNSSECDTSATEGVYCLARSDSPPPLPERTYLKLRTTTKENNNPQISEVLSLPLGYDARGKCVAFPSTERNTNIGIQSTGIYSVQKHIDYERPYHTPHPSAFSEQAGCSTSKPFVLPYHLKSDFNHNTASSGYGSVNSDTFSVNSEMSVPPSRAPTSCKLPRRSRRVSTDGPCALNRASTASGYCSNRASGENRLTPDNSSQLHTNTPESTQPRFVDNNPTAHKIADFSISRKKVHNLPLLPDQGRVELIRTIHLDTVLKDKWISGIAVTKKNEIILVDQREAYLLDEDGNLKKSIGTKGTNRLLEPLNVSVMPANGHLVICDHADQDIKIFNWRGQFLRRVKDQGLTNIAGVSTTEDRNIVIAGTDKKRVSVLSDEGKLLYTIPKVEAETTKSSPKAKSPFEHPYSVAVNPLTGDIIIGDDTKQVVTAVSPSKDGQSPRVLWRYSPGSGNRHFFPSSICADANGYIFIADLYNEMVYMLDSSGRFVKTLLSRGNGLKGGPGAIATDCKGHILVADEEKTLKIFRYGDEKGFTVNRRYSYVPQVS